MPQFYPLYLRRSDGVINLKGGKNEPAPNQLDPKPNAHGIADFYRLSPTGDPKETEWRRKLGGMLIREIGDAEQSNGREHPQAFETTLSCLVLTLLRKELHFGRPSRELSRLRASEVQALR